jgi:hypothetical protein
MRVLRANAHAGRYLIAPALLLAMVLIGATMAVSATATAAPDRRQPPRPLVHRGPASPTSPQIDAYYSLLSRGECATLAQQTPPDQGATAALYHAAARLCLTDQVPGTVVDWTALTAALAGSRDIVDCLSRDVRVALRHALDIHAAKPGQTDRFGQASKGTACIPVPTQVVLVQDPSGSSSVVVFGQRLFEVTGVQINHTWFAATSRNAQEGTECARADVVGAPALAVDSAITLRVRGNGYKTPTQEWLVGPAVPTSQVDQSNGAPGLDTATCTVTQG